MRRAGRTLSRWSSVRRPLAAPIDEIARACILVALAGVGLSTRLVQIRSMGPRAFYVGCGTAVTVAVLSLAALPLSSR